MTQNEITREDAESLMRAGFVGAVGKAYVIRNTPWGRVLSRFPKKSDKPPTDKQMVVRERFSRAIATAKDKLADPDIVQAYRKKVSNGESVFHLLVADCLKEKPIGRKKWWKWSKSKDSESSNA